MVEPITDPEPWDEIDVLTRHAAEIAFSGPAAIMTACHDSPVRLLRPAALRDCASQS
jgi:hypothetical protein